VLKEEVVSGVKGNKWRLVDGLVTIGGGVYIPLESPSLAVVLTNVHEMTTRAWRRISIGFAEISLSLGHA
jgi:hypothetical protein